MRMHSLAFASIMLCCLCATARAQRLQFPPASGLPSNQIRPINDGVPTGQPQMVPINPATQSGVFPSTAPGGASFDPYANPPPSSSWLGGPIVPVPASPLFGNSVSPAQAYGNPVLPPSSMGGSITGPGYAYNNPTYYGGAPTLPGQSLPAPSLPGPGLPGTGPSANIGTFPSNPPAYNQPGIYPNEAPSALFPGVAPGAGNWYGTWPDWNPQGSVFGGQGTVPGFIRLFQGPRFRHAFVYGNDDPDALMINDSDLSLAFVVPNFLLSTQPLYLLPSFSLHQWAGPKPPSTADLPPVAYSAFLDSGWQSDPAAIFGAELGLRVGMFTDFDTANSDSLRVMGRGIGRVRLTPRATAKLGVIYLDRNDIKLLPAGGLLWQPNPNTRFDIFFPEPKFSSYLTTLGTKDVWWYAGGYYGGGAWTIQRASGGSDSIDINDIRLLLGLEFGQNELMREGRRNAFIEVGYVFDRELLYRNAGADSMSLQDTIMFRAGIGY